MNVRRIYSHPYFLIVAIILIAAALRLPFLDTHMPAVYGDEVSIGYNAYSILKTGHDEYGYAMPIQFESWGDKKNPVYIYTVAIFQFFLGLNEWSLRLPSAISGVAAVFLTYEIVRLLFNKQSDATAHVAAFLLAISPWHVHISRGGFEANLAVTLGLLSVYGFLRWCEKGRRKWLIVCATAAVLAMYTYYTTKLFLPLLLIIFWVWNYRRNVLVFSKNIQRHFSYLQTGLIFFLFMSLASTPFIYLAVFKGGQNRFSSINIFSQDSVIARTIQSRAMFPPTDAAAKILFNKGFIWLHDFAEYYFDNFSGSFWYVNGDSSLRYAIGNHGMFYLFEAPFLAIGLVALYKKNRSAFTILATWLLLAPVPTALVGKAYGLRSLAMLPVPQIFVAFGIICVYEWLNEKYTQKIVYGFGTILTLVVMASFGNWLARYAYIYPLYGYYSYDGAMKDLIRYAVMKSPSFDQVIVNRRYGRSEIYFAYYQRLDPRYYLPLTHQTVDFAGVKMVKIGKFYFGDLNDKGKLDKGIPINDLKIPPHTLVLSVPEFPFGDPVAAQDDGRTLFKSLSVE